MKEDVIASEAKQSHGNPEDRHAPSGLAMTLLADLLRYPAGEPEMEELYVRTFDIQAVCTLDVGYVLFGEDYKRGHFLVKMQELQNRCANDCGSELPDHLPNILTLLPKMPRDEAKDLVGRIVHPAVGKMIEGFKNSGNVYSEILRGVSEVLKEDYL